MKRQLVQLIKSMVILGVVICMFLVIINVTPVFSSGAYKWRLKKGSWYLYDHSGTMLTGWQKVEGTWYYMSKSGVMRTGWQKLSGNWFYLDSTGAMLTGWQFIGNKWYYLNEYGVMVTGWYLEDDIWYYLEPSGAMKTGWLEWNGRWYYLKKNGAMLTGPQWLGKDLCYFNENGSLRSGNKPVTDSSMIVHINIRNYNQNTNGYPLGCEGVSLYMALRGLGYADSYTLKEFMDTMPKGDTPYEGYMGNPCIGRDGENEGKRTSIYPEPLTAWANQFGPAKDLTGASIEDLIEELKDGHVILIYATGKWNEPTWTEFPWSRTPKGEVTNNHCLCVVGVYDDNSFMVNDCGHVPAEYRVDAELFRSIYEARRFAVAVG